MRKNISGSWGERSFFFQGAGSKDTPPPGGASYRNLSLSRHRQKHENGVFSFAYSFSTVNRTCFVLLPFPDLVRYRFHSVHWASLRHYKHLLDKPFTILFSINDI